MTSLKRLVLGIVQGLSWDTGRLSKEVIADYEQRTTHYINGLEEHMNDCESYVTDQGYETAPYHYAVEEMLKFLKGEVQNDVEVPQ